ncbi:MAG: UvrD-helicase domain-containing protein [Candidatus Saccharibacteria bacterium]|nr:UvrD-helicase domain-containing protein [Candidatus Saccharibacteria bacterium]
MGCVTEQHHNHLVVAGAGTGKTTTIVGKIKWAISQGLYQPEEILVLSFTNASAAEMKERILSETKDLAEGEVVASTFHKLGLEILKQCSKTPIKIARLSLEEFVMRNLAEDEQSYAESLTNIISVARMEDIDLDELLEEAYKRRKIKEEDLELVRRARDINEAYKKELSARNEIDFSDMINTATKFIRDGKYKNPFRFVIVDEYQDISKPRFEMLKALRDLKDYDLFCVGDDWQAIYRFAGSEVNLILEFEKFWGNTKLSRIETTYRFPASIADASGRFIMENYRQIPKKIKAMPDDDYNVTEICADSVLQTIEESIRILRQLPNNATVFYLGRYTRDRSILKLYFKVEKDQVIFDERPDLTINFMTAHKSKGLQADYVFAMNLKDAKMGFPSKVESSEIMKLIHPNAEKFPFAEERRLFYVTMTRAKKHLYLLTMHGHKSVFILELENLLYKKMKIIDIGLMEN